VQVMLTGTPSSFVKAKEKINTQETAKNSVV